jgi:hypothetical protein
MVYDRPEVIESSPAQNPSGQMQPGMKDALLVVA